MNIKLGNTVVATLFLLIEKNKHNSVHADNKIDNILNELCISTQPSLVMQVVYSGEQ